jgi:hypothetical protein
VFGLPHGLGVGLSGGVIRGHPSSNKEVNNSSISDRESGQQSVDDSKESKEVAVPIGPMAAPSFPRLGGLWGVNVINNINSNPNLKRRYGAYEDECLPCLEEEDRPKRPHSVKPPKEQQKRGGGNVNNFNVNQDVKGSNAVISIKNMN